jgi:hypothetical protein
MFVFGPRVDEIAGYGGRPMSWDAMPALPGQAAKPKIDDMASSDTSTFLNSVVAAFPTRLHPMAEGAAKSLAALVDGSYRIRQMAPVVVLGGPILIPYRIHLVGINEAWPKLQAQYSPAIQCICTRSTDGHVRHAALRSVLGIEEPWVVPFVVLLAGEYVVEIIADMVASLPTLQRGIYAEFVRENRHLIRRLRSKTTSYWDCYYRHSYPDRSSYPGLVFLHRLETWAS